jgi:hypothetical protein
MRDKRGQVLTLTIPVGDHGVDDCGVRSKVFAGIGKERLERIFPQYGLKKNVRGVREESFLGAGSDHFVLIVDEHNEDFEAIDGREMRSRGADRELAFAGRAAMPQIFNYLRA